MLGAVTNTIPSENDPLWIQTSLPIKLGGLGVLRALQLAPPAYLTSISVSDDLV